MPQWEGIEDASSPMAPIWLQRALPEQDGTTTTNSPKKGTGTAAASSNNSSLDWKPLRKSDCQKLNNAVTVDANSSVVIECGRATAFPAQGRLRYNFCNSNSERALDCASWFVVQDDGRHHKPTETGPAPSSLLPVFHKQDSFKIEALYQKAIQAASNLGKGIATVLNETVQLNDESKVQVVKQFDGRLSMKQIPKGSSWSQQLFTSTNLLLQRGYGEYMVPGEETELQLGPVRHLIFVVHGIGENLFSRDDVALPCMVDTLNQTRMTLQEKQVADWNQRCQKQPNLPPPNRIELVPIEWFDELHDSSSSLMKSLRAATLPSIPALRAIANDVVFDVLLYLTPSFCHAVLECVTRKINQFYDRFNEIYPDFATSGGKYSLIGHSLGSVICWDLLSILQQKQNEAAVADATTMGEASPSLSSHDAPSLRGVVSGAQHPPEEVGYQAYAGHELSSREKAKIGTWGPSVSQTLEQSIPFVPETTLFLGSPLGIFLTLRGAHPVFDELRTRQEHQQQKDNPDATAVVPEISPFTLPSGSVYNIFHPSDPIAYRIEPLLLSPDLDPDIDLPPPLYLTAPGKGIRLDLKAKQLGDEVRRTLKDPKKNSWSSLLSTAVTVLSTEVPASAGNVPKSLTNPSSSGVGSSLSTGELVFPLGGKTARVDFSLQPGVVTSEYLSAVMAHGSYFSNADFQDFLIGLVADNESTKILQ